jgi:hypothetical protein
MRIAAPANWRQGPRLFRAVTSGARIEDPRHRPSPTIVSLIAGILILIVPRLLNYIVATFLIVSGVIGLGLLRWEGSEAPPRQD